jgi:UDP-N-acetylglucosamine 4,6-dehydratase/5-epimerase
MLDNSVIMITGGTGTFGQSATRFLLENYKPRKIVIYSRDELKQHEMSKKFDSDKLRFLLGDIRDLERLKVAMKSVDFVVHTAALKQVPAAEYNPMECIKTNIHGAENVIHAAWEEGVKKVIALSTDKAAQPINLYGATKLASDKLFSAANYMFGNKRTIFAVVRYGNVAGSRGSVMPLFSDLIKNSSPFLPITDPKMTRFWIDLEEGVKFVFKSFDRMIGGEMFIPKLPSVRITDLATAMAPNLEQKIIGIRPGEKIHELLCPVDDSPRTIEFDNFLVVHPTVCDLDSALIETTKLGEIGRLVDREFEYSSGRNPVFLSLAEIKTFNSRIGY